MFNIMVILYITKLNARINIFLEITFRGCKWQYILRGFIFANGAISMILVVSFSRIAIMSSLTPMNDGKNN